MRALSLKEDLRDLKCYSVTGLKLCKGLTRKTSCLHLRIRFPLISNSKVSNILKYNKKEMNWKINIRHCKTTRKDTTII